MTTRDVDVIEEVENNFLVSSYDTNAARAFPDVRDGLKPGQRACLWDMHVNGFVHSKPHVKSAKISGSVISAWWPHGDTAIYETFVRMSQPFTNVLPEVEWHGANGNVIAGGDSFASSRYTEARLSQMAEDYMMRGIDHGAVDMQLNFSEDREWPTVLPSVFPRLLVNGSQGIGVGIAQTFACHNLRETCDLIVDYIQTGHLNSDNYFPDMPCGATIVNKDELAEINETGRGRILMEAKWSSDGRTITFTEFPYQVYVEPVLEQIRAGVESGAITGISRAYNESDRTHVALVVECARGASVDSVVSQLMEQTDLRSQMNVNQNALVGKTPRLLNLRQLVDAYVAHNVECIRRVAEHDRAAARARLEILEGIMIAIAHMDDVVRIIRESESSKEAMVTLIASLGLTEPQAKAILDMRLSRLSRMSRTEVEDEASSIRDSLVRLDKLATSDEARRDELVGRLHELALEYGCERRTEVTQRDVAKKEAKTRKKEKSVATQMRVSLDRDGYLHAGTCENVVRFIDIMSDEYFVLYTSGGKAYRVRGEDVLKKGTVACGALIPLDALEQVVFMTSNEKDADVLVCLTDGRVRRFAAKTFAGKVRTPRGITYVSLDDRGIVWIGSANDSDYVTMRSSTHEITFPVSDVPARGRGADGVVGLSIRSSVDTVKSCEVGPLRDGMKSQKRAGIGHKIH